MQDFEEALTRNLLWVYYLRAECMHLNSTMASGYWRVTEDGLFQIGHSKDHLPPRVWEAYLGPVAGGQPPLTRLTRLPLMAPHQKAILLLPRWRAP
jgi:hypothetical protein